MTWPKVKLGSILSESKIISEFPNPDKRITVRLKVLGVEKRGLENEVEGATKQYIRKAGQFIYGKQNFHKGAFGIVPQDLDGFESSSDLPSFDVDKSCLSEFLFYFFKQGNFYLELSKIASGVATQRINTTQLFDLEIPLPDIKTQKQLISRIELLENNGAEISTEQTHQISLVKQLRQAFLREAMQGTLIKSNKVNGKETGQQLLEHIKKEKQDLINQGKLKKEKQLQLIQPEEMPFEIPKNWAWCRLGDIALLNGRIGWKGLSASEYRKEGPLFLSVHSLNYGDYVDYTQAFHISQERYDESPEIMLKENDILICKDGAGIGKLGIIKNLKEPATVNSSLLIIRGLEILNIKFIYYYLLSGHFQKIVNDRIMGATTPHLYQRDLVNFLVALPSLKEQTLLVQRLEQFMQTCDELEQSIKQSQQHNEMLLQQVLREALKG